MVPPSSTARLRVRYSDIDALGTYYNSRALEWFEVARLQWLRDVGRPYREIEAAGYHLPVTEAHLRFLGRATFDDELVLSTRVQREGRAAVRFQVRVTHAETGAPVCEGYTIHAFTDAAGKPLRPPRWFLDLLGE
ncbi:acyl-CoA thioesterase [bacterium]|nr:acyl-CoA thioesterase [bacterium]